LILLFLVMLLHFLFRLLCPTFSAICVRIMPCLECHPRSSFSEACMLFPSRNKYAMMVIVCDSRKTGKRTQCWNSPLEVLLLLGLAPRYARLTLAFRPSMIGFASLTARSAASLSAIVTCQMQKWQQQNKDMSRVSVKGAVDDSFQSIMQNDRGSRTKYTKMTRLKIVLNIFHLNGYHLQFDVYLFRLYLNAMCDVSESLQKTI
jgi:hypothetical protein